ncbi:serine hydrolase domain-containing protein [Bryobacter aggregatus]|uniref:serine hydrolase domain-containing protein n=1 Tax=Bryobacter aggregatus TaxID=360054 RepID=UPI0004E27885|nr:serine hydrolase domain-containing protein [Bryobacter aggregatus]
MKHWLLILLPLLAHAANIERLDGSKISTIEAEAFARKTLEEAKVAGAQLAVINNGKLAWSMAFGIRTLEPKQPMQTTTAIWAASITKGVFASYVMQLAARGEIQLDKPIAPQFPKPLNEFEPYKLTAEELVKDPQWQLVTPRMLLSHTSGLHNFAFLEPDKKMHLHFKPGTSFLYSGEAINIVQFYIEQQKQKPLDQLMQEALFTPLGMNQSGIIFQKKMEPNIADRFNASGAFISQTRRFPARAAGSLTTSVEDLARYTEAILNGKVLTAASRKDMLRPVLMLKSLHQFPVEANEPEGKEGPAVGLAYATGWGVLTKTKFGPAFFKEGHGDGAQNYMICFTRSKSCMILLTNSDNGELAFRPLLEKILGNTVTPWEWEGYTPSRRQSN